MTHFLNINQLAEEAAEQGLDSIVGLLEEAANCAAQAICAKRGDVAIIEHASNEPGFAGLCVGFGPVKPDDKCPDDFVHYDESSGWAQDEEE